MSAQRQVCQIKLTTQKEKAGQIQMSVSLENHTSITVSNMQQKEKISV